MLFGQIDRQLQRRPAGVSAFQCTCCRDGKTAEHLTLGAAEQAGLAVDDTQRADAMAVAEADWRAGIKTYGWSAKHQGVIGEANIVVRIGDFKDIGAQDGVGTKRDVPRGFRRPRKPHIRLEPLTVDVDEADQGDRCATHQAGSLNQCIELYLRSRVQYVERLQCGNTCRLGERHLSGLHLMTFRARRAQWNIFQIVAVRSCELACKFRLILKWREIRKGFFM